MAATQITPLEVWKTALFLCDWPGHDRHAPAIEAAIRAEAEGYDRPVASGIATSAKPAQGLVESPLNLFHRIEDPSLRALATWMDGCIRTVVSTVNGSRVPADRLRVEFTESWFHITNDGGFHDAHTHGACSWCGIYYLRAGEPDAVTAEGTESAGNGINRFYGPIGMGGMTRDYGNQWLSRTTVDIQPIEGRLVLFPSYLLHSALPYRGASDRIILSFNSRTHRA